MKFELLPNTFDIQYDNMRSLGIMVTEKLAKIRFAKLIQTSLLSMNPQTDSEMSSIATEKLIGFSHNASYYIEMVVLLVDLMRIEDTLSTGFIIHFLEVMALPEATQLNRLSTRLLQKIRSAKNKQESTRLTAASAVVWGILAEKLAGKVSEKLFSDQVCSMLMASALDVSWSLAMLYSLIALESFSMTASNKSKLIARGFLEMIKKLPCYAVDETPFSHEINFCVKNLIKLMKDCKIMTCPDIECIFKNVNCTVNWQLSSSFWKLSQDFTEIRNDRIGFASAQGTTCIVDGQWYYEVELITGGIMQIGWATKHSHFEPEDGVGVGDESHSFGYDGCRNLYWFMSESSPYGTTPWLPGDILGVYLDADSGSMQYFINGADLGPCYYIDQGLRERIFQAEEGLFPALSLTTYQHAKVNFGHMNFTYPPELPFTILNDYGQLTKEIKLGPDYTKFLLLGDPEDQEGDPCEICFLNPGNLTILPCRHDKLCMECVSRMKICPFCRVEISSWKTQTLNDTSTTTPAPEPIIAANKMAIAA